MLAANEKAAADCVWQFIVIIEYSLQSGILIIHSYIIYSSGSGPVFLLRSKRTLEGGQYDYRVAS